MVPALRSSPQQAEGRPIRIVVCDDSSFMRRFIRSGLETAGDIEVVGSAANAREAVELCNTLFPDILTLDLELPDLHGTRVLDLIQGLPVRVLVVSSFTTDMQSDRAVDAMARGAVDCLGKPNLSESPSLFIAELLDRVRNIAHGAAVFPLNHGGAAGTKTQLKHTGNVHHVRQRLVIIGASTGGPRALHAMLPTLSPDFPAPIIVVQHMPKHFTSHFARHLDEAVELDVVEASTGDELKAGTVYVAPGGHHLHIEGNHLAVREGTRVNGLMPSIDVTMIDAAMSWRNNVTGVILTGIGRDGREGARAIKGAGGTVIAEDETTCAVYGMPQSVVDAGLADTVMPLLGIAQQLCDEVGI